MAEEDEATTTLAQLGRLKTNNETLTATKESAEKAKADVEAQVA